MTRSEIYAFLIRLSLLTLFAGVLWLAFQAREILGALLMAWLTAILASPILESLEKKKIPSSLAIAILCLSVLSILLLVGVIIFPLFAEQVVRFEGIITNVMQNVSALSANPDSLKDYAIFRYLERASIDVNVVWITDFLKNSVSTIVEHIGGLVTTGSTSLFSWIFGFFWAFSNIILYLIFLVFILIERKDLYHNLVAFLPKKTATHLHTKTPSIQSTLFSWWRGQAILCASIWGMTLVMLVFLKYVLGIQIEHFFSLALIAGICEFIPIIGPLVALIPAAIMGMQGGWVDVVIIIIAYVSIQQIESLFLVPRVQGAALSLSNVEVLVWMTLSSSLFGVVGILFTLPILAVTKILFANKKTA